MHFSTNASSFGECQGGAWSMIFCVYCIVILENYGAHKHSKVCAWLDRHPRYLFQCTRTSCSWLNAVEGVFTKLTRRCLKHGVFPSIVELQAAINRFLRETNDNPKSFTWTAGPSKIIAAVRHGHQALDSIH